METLTNLRKRVLATEDSEGDSDHLEASKSNESQESDERGRSAPNSGTSVAAVHSLVEGGDSSIGSNDEKDENPPKRKKMEKNK